MPVKRLTAMLLTCLLLLCCGCAMGRGAELNRYEGSFLDVFDTVTRVVVYAPDEAAAEEVIARTHELLQREHQLYDIYHTYAGMNNLKTLNDAAGGEPVPVDGRILELLAFSKDMYARTDGLVNVALGSVLRLWHDCREQGILDPAHAALPDGEALREAGRHADINDLELDEAAGTARLLDPQMRLDVGSVAKGFAVQYTADVLAAEGVTNVLLSIGGNVCAIGGKPDGTPWRIGIQSPEGEGYLCAVAVEDRSVVTSGSYERAYTVDGKPYHHIIDPETLMPGEGFTSVTVLCPDSGAADALSTALFLLPVEQGRALLASVDGAEALWVDAAGKQTMTEGFQERLTTP